MTSRNRRRGRQASMKARVGIAAAVLAGGGAAGVAVAANHGPASTEASSAGYIMGIQHHISVQDALSSALGTWGRTASSHQRALDTLAHMAPMQNYTQVWGPRHTRWAHTQFAAQRGVVVATGTVKGKQFLIVRSANGGLKLWWVNANTGFVNTATNSTALVAMSGNNNNSVQAAVNGNTAPLSNQMAGSMANQAKAAAGGFSFTGTFTFNGQTFTITITAGGTGTVSPSTMPPSTPATGTTMATAPASTPATSTSMATGQGMVGGTATASAMPSPSTSMSTMPTGTAMATSSATPTASASTPITLQTLVQGDLVLVTGVRQHGQLTAQLVLLLKPATVMPTPSTSTSMAVTPSTAPATPTAPATSSTHL